MTHPDYIVAPEARADLPLLEPVYPLTAGLSGKVLLKAARQALERVPELPEWQDAAWLKAARLARCQRRRLRACTGPTEAGRRLAGLAALAAPRLRRAAGGPAGARPGAPEPQVAARPQRRRATAASARRIADALPFALTNSQRQALKEIAEDMARAAPHAAAAAGRRRLRQDGGGADGHGDRGGGRRAGRPDGADRSAGAPACRHHRAACRRRGPAHRRC